MTLKELVGDKRTRIIDAAARHGASNIRVFGSFCRGDASETSDVDFLVDFEPDISLLDHAGLIVALEDLLGRPVDVVPSATLRPHLRRKVLKEAVPL